MLMDVDSKPMIRMSFFFDISLLTRQKDGAYHAHDQLGRAVDRRTSVSDVCGRDDT